MSCGECGAPCQGALCKQCEVESAYEHLANELSADEADEEVTPDA